MQSYTYLAEEGLLDRLKTRLGFRLYAETRAYQALQRNRFVYIVPMFFEGESSGNWEQLFQDAQAFADRFQTNVIMIDRQKVVDELKSKYTNSPTVRPSETPRAGEADGR